ncbi:enoyl-CoA hydratase/isomerase family protein [Paenibacillus sp. BSR1-1]|uniref:enoyl-CoA hydratase/isomerase family protein n=1 Tax=Paenibacillus sp. BSR1-1 TaxID=3020845 RepID=UPI0025B1E995|nr:enoyl-CoA hydratase/isomerase family protein [Paenibacillus sp. BSR1-1]MDN3016173.1 enoyl-CoA hydratase/isomerase family protein [Paenibacillus sp. BSR1-1]
METISYEQEGLYGIIRLNRPDVLNALNDALCEEFIDLLNKLEDEIEPRVLIITGNERAFSAGADLKSLLAMQQLGKLNPTEEFLGKVKTLFNKIERYSKPVIAAIDGIAYGGGCELALSCDFRIASTKARICLSEVKIGVLPAGGGTQRLPRLIGLSRAKYMLLSGEPIEINTLYDWGLLHEVVSSDELLSKAKEFAAPFLNGAPLAQKAIKNLALSSTNTDLDSGLEIEKLLSNNLHHSNDAKEGIAAFNQKRKPIFQGK